jgi:hypothetical protein
MEIDVEKLPEALRKKDLEEKLAKFVEKTMLSFWQCLDLLLEENRAKKAMLISQ